MLFAAWVLAMVHGSGFQEPERCALSREVGGAPYCLAAVYAGQLERMARAYRAEQDSMQAAVVAGTPTRSYRPLARAVAYWSRERRRIARDGCRRLSEFDVGSDSTAAGLLVAGYCAFVAVSTANDSMVSVKVLRQLEATEAGRAPPALASEATDQAEGQQRAEEINRAFLVLSAAWTHLLAEPDGGMSDTAGLPDTPAQRFYDSVHAKTGSREQAKKLTEQKIREGGFKWENGAPSGSRLALTPAERRSLAVLMRRVASIERGGMFAQSGKVLGDWLNDPKWRTRPAKAR